MVYFYLGSLDVLDKLSLMLLLILVLEIEIAQFDNNNTGRDVGRNSRHPIPCSTFWLGVLLLFSTFALNDEKLTH